MKLCERWLTFPIPLASTFAFNCLEALAKRGYKREEIFALATRVAKEGARKEDREAAERLVKRLSPRDPNEELDLWDQLDENV